MKLYDNLYISFIFLNMIYHFLIWQMWSRDLLMSVLFLEFQWKSLTLYHWLHFTVLCFSTEVHFQNEFHSGGKAARVCSVTRNLKRLTGLWAAHLSVSHTSTNQHQPWDGHVTSVRNPPTPHPKSITGGLLLSFFLSFFTQFVHI